VFSYITYGLRLRSDLKLPELLAGDETLAEEDVVIRLNSPAPPPEFPGLINFSFYDSQTICIRSKRVGTFCARSGREIVVEPTPDADEELLRLFILGPALAMLLYQRGMLVLHASAVALAGNGVAFLGFSGWGKSTTAAALHTRGHGVIADDMVAVQMDDAGEQPIVWPGFPQLKLWPEAATSLGVPPESLITLHHTYVKRARKAEENFSSAPLPLKRLYVLAEGDAQSIEQLPPQDAVIELVRHSFGTRLLSSQPSGAHFSRCASLAKRLPVHRLTRPRLLDELPMLAQLVEQDVLQHILDAAGPRSHNGHAT
jgi:hypothetical protein